MIIGTIQTTSCKHNIFLVRCVKTDYWKFGCTVKWKYDVDKLIKECPMWKESKTYDPSYWWPLKKVNCILHRDMAVQFFEMLKNFKSDTFDIKINMPSFEHVEHTEIEREI